MAPIHAISHILRKGRQPVILLALLWALFPLRSFAGQKYTIYFYNPETNINNFASLKKEFDTYLLSFGEYQFQPFNERETFEKLITERKDGIFLVSSWHYRKLKETIPLEPMLVAVYRDKSTCRKILSVKKSIDNLNLLKGATVASAGSEEYTRSILRQMLKQNNEDVVRSLKILTVPKDIDALMSVGFGMAGAAITTEGSLAKLAMMNQKQFDMLQQLAASDDTLLPVIAAPKPYNDACKKLTSLIKEMGVRQEGKQKLTMIGLDGWKELNDSEKEILEKR